MPDRTFTGPVPEVDLMLSAGAVRVKQGEKVTVSDEEAASLDAQGSWTGGEPAKDSSTPKPADPVAAPSKE